MTVFLNFLLEFLFKVGNTLIGECDMDLGKTKRFFSRPKLTNFVVKYFFLESKNKAFENGDCLQKI